MKTKFTKEEFESLIDGYMEDIEQGNINRREAVDALNINIKEHILAVFEGLMKEIDLHIQKKSTMGGDYVDQTQYNNWNMLDDLKKLLDSAVKEIK